MIYSKIIGGLGNAMFQYAFAKKLSKFYNIKLILDYSLYNKYYKIKKCELEVFNLPEKFSYEDSMSKINKFKEYLVKKNLIDSQNFLMEKKINFNKIKNDKKFPLYVSGYWQSYKYFDDIKIELLDLFKFPKITDERNLYLFELIKNVHTTSIFCRRGDFVNNKKINKIHGFCDLDFYKRSISMARELCPETKLIFFSDDSNWIYENFKIDDNIIVDWNKLTPYRDMQLFSKSNINISSNSTFSWWGAYLNTNKDKKIIVPEKWYKNKPKHFRINDLIPRDWIRV